MIKTWKTKTRYNKKLLDKNVDFNKGLICLLVFILYIPVNNFLIMLDGSSY